MTENKLTPEQIQQLINTAAEEPVHAFSVLKDCPLFTLEQRQQLVAAIAKSSQVSAWALTQISWLTENQREQLKVVA